MSKLLPEAKRLIFLNRQLEKGDLTVIEQRDRTVERITKIVREEQTRYPTFLHLEELDSELEIDKNYQPDSDNNSTADTITDHKVYFVGGMILTATLAAIVMVEGLSRVIGK
jgi:hypothetical protein